MRARQLLRGLATATTVVAVVLGGCAPQPTSRDATINPGWQDCWAVRPFQTTHEPNTLAGVGTIPRGFRPTSAVECVEERQRDADGSIVSLAVERRSSTITALTAAFALRSVRDDGAMCAGVGWERPWLFLLDGEGRWISPEIPVDECEQPRKEYTAAYSSTHFSDAASRLLRVEQPVAAIQAGCSGQETDMAWFVTLERRKKAGTLNADPLGNRRAKLCVYSVTGTDESSKRAGGQFVAGRRLSRPGQAAIVAAMVGSLPAEPCRRPAGKFAALHRTDNRGTSVYVELTGCRRVVVVYGENNYLLSQAGPDLLQLLEA